MVAGALGGFLVGLFATPEGSAGFGLTNWGGAISGNGKQVWLQIVGALFIIGWNLVWTSLIMLFIKYVCRVPLRYSDDILAIGDDAIHSEEAYCFYDNYDGLEPTQSTIMRAADAERHMIPGLGSVRDAHKQQKMDILEGISPPNQSGEDTPPEHVKKDGSATKAE